MFMYTVEPPYFELIGSKLKLSWLKTFPLILQYYHCIIYYNITIL